MVKNENHKAMKIKINDIDKINKKIEYENLLKSVNHKPTPSVIYKNPRKCSTKSQWAWKIEKEGEQEKEKELKYEKKEAVVIYDGKEIDIYYGKVEKIAGKEIYNAKIWKKGSKKINVKLVKAELDEMEKNVKSGEEYITIEDLYKIKLKTGVEIYNVIEIK